MEVGKLSQSHVSATAKLSPSRIYYASVHLGWNKTMTKDVEHY